MLINRSFTIINLLVLTALVYLSVGIFYDVVNSRFSVARTVPPPPVVDSDPMEQELVHPESYYKVIMDRNLFKAAEVVAPKAPPKIDPDKLEETKLQLKLWGTVSGDENRAYAVIEESQKREQNLFRVGDSVQNATVKMILREKVILSFNGKDEVLTMEDLKTSGAAGGPAPGPRPALSSAAPMPETGAERSQKITLRRSIIEDSVRDISKLMTQIQIRPHLEDGMPTGLSLSNIQPNSIFRRMGLRNGDIITGVDGQNIQSVDDALKLYENLRNSDAVNVDIKRRGRERKIEYQIR